MAVYTPTVTYYPDGVVSVASIDNTNYSTIVESMGSFVYGVEEVYIKSENVDQILQNFTFNSYDANGNLQNFVDVITVDPYQKQSAVNTSLVGKDIVFDGRTSVDFEILPNENVNMVFTTKQLSNRDELKPTYFFCDDFFTSQLNITNDFL
jgi:hypothetical protein